MIVGAKVNGRYFGQIYTPISHLYRAFELFTHVELDFGVQHVALI